jgi:hypothetical protein
MGGAHPLNKSPEKLVKRFGNRIYKFVRGAADKSVQLGTQTPLVQPNVGKLFPLGQSLAVVQVGAQVLLPDRPVAQVQPCEFGGHFVDVQSAFVVHDWGPLVVPPSPEPVPPSPPGPVPPSPPGPVPPSPPVGCDLVQDAGIVAVKRISPRSRPMRHGGEEPSAAAPW